MLAQFDPLGLQLLATAAFPCLIVLGMVWGEQIKHAWRGRRK